MNEEKLQAIASAAVTEADTLALVYSEVLKARLSAQLEAISTNLIYEMASKLARSAVQLKTETIVEEKTKNNLEIKRLPIPKAKLEQEKPKLHLAG